MDIKYRKTLIYLFIFTLLILVSSFDYVKNSRLKLLLSADKDSCSYNNSTVNLSIILNNSDIFPFFVRKMMSIDSRDNSEMIIDIRCKGERYYHEQEYCGRNLSHSKFIVYKNRPYKRTYLLNMRQLIEKYKVDSVNKLIGQAVKFYEGLNLDSMVEMVTEESKKHPLHVGNKNFGTYHIQAKYVKSKNDTIYSNILKVAYLPK